MKKIPHIPLLFLAFAASLSLRAETCKLQTYASSWMATGTPFSVKCPSGDYSGHLVSTPARRFFRRGHLMLVFDQPVVLRPKKEGDEGKIVAGRTRQITNMLVGGGVSVGSKDLVDGISGAVFKSGYMIPITGVAFAFFTTGGDVLLKPGYELQIISREERSSKSVPASTNGN
ncbi:MAG: hypothetical protein JST28_12990 [Acidobacteria bacterium]|nr:hypothetical protein [Acidobacteriota bacterium]